MHKTMLFLAVFGLAGSLWAADPIIGTWRLDTTESKIQPTPTSPQKATDTYRLIDGNQIEFTRRGVQGDGTPIYSRWVWPAQGGAAERLEPSPLPDETSYIELLIEPGYWYVTILQDGKQSLVMQKNISKDGKIMRITEKSRDEGGKLIEDLYVFEKQ